MRVKVILNPSSDLGRAERQEQAILDAARPYGQLEIDTTGGQGHAQALAAQAAEDGYDIVAAAGGDGTVHEVVNGLVTNGHTQVKLGVIPLGSGNDFAFGLGITKDVQTAVARLFTGTSQRIDLGRVEDDHGRRALFDNNLGVGFDAVVVIRTASITRVHGFMMYLLAVLQSMAFYYDTPVLKMRFDDEPVTQPVLFVTFGLGPRHGGGFFLTPDAQPNDDRIDSCTANAISRLTMLRMLTRAIRGTHVNSPHVTMRQNRRIEIESQTPLSIHIDGEVFAYPEDNVRHLSVISLPGALEVLT